MNKITQRKWYLIDANGKSLGRLASEIAILLRGKNDAKFVPYLDNGANVIVVNTDELKITGKKSEQKKYFHYSGYPGGIKEIVYEKLFAQDSGDVIKRAVLLMLPKNKLRPNIMKRLKCFKNANHPYKDKF